MTRIFLVIMLVFGLGLLTTRAAVDPKKIKNRMSSARKNTQSHGKSALTELAELVSENNFKRLGFNSLAEAKKGVLGEGLPVYYVRLDELQKYKASTDPHKLLHGITKIIYPVKVNNQVRSSVQLEKNGDKWEATAFGRPEAIKIFTTARTQHAGRTKKAKSEFFVVQISALNLYLLGHQTDKAFNLIPLLDSKSYKLKAGAETSARMMFLHLVPYAKSHKGNPR